MLQPTLTVINAWNGDEDVLTYEFEVYADKGMTILAASATSVLEGDSTTSWQVDVELDGDSWCWWRVQARDDENLASGWSELQVFFINMGNQAPSGISIVSPEDESEVASLAATLVLNNATDPQGDTVTYDIQLNNANIFDSIVLMEVFDFEEGAEGTTTSWPLPEDLTDNTHYYWRVRPCDNTVCGDWIYSSLFVNLVNDTPTAPGIISPVDGSQVTSTTPALTVLRAADPDMNALTYTFEVYADEDLTSLVDSASGEAGSPGRPQARWTTTQRITGAFVPLTSTPHRDHGRIRQCLRFMSRRSPPHKFSTTWRGCL